MIILTATVFGVLLGILTARRQGGRRLDQWHYATAFGIGFAVLGILVTVILSRVG